MKTPEQKAADYCRNTHGICATCKKIKKCDIEEQIGNCKSKYPYYFAFLVGYEYANEWISVDNEPKKEMWIIAKTEYPKALPFYKSMFYILENKEQLKINFTHWKPIN